LGEAVVYLKRAVRRRFGSEVTVRLVSPESSEAKQGGWVQDGLLPVVVIDGLVFCRGRLSLKEIVRKLKELKEQP
jgi:hypothetical protein